MKYQDVYQFFLLFFAFLVVFGVGVFVYKEVFPEYKTYQYAYIDLEKERAERTRSKIAPFSTGIKQILIEDNKQGPEVIDRCISCHVALDLPHFSPVRVARDVNNQITYDAKGKPLLELNPDYVWNYNEAPEEVQKALQMHPLIGAETRPFQYHSMEEYGCTSCHSGNGRSLVAKRAHGPVYDGNYEPAYVVDKPQFTEVDEENDPSFSRMYNDKPGHDLAFQTTPLLAGDLIVAKCVQCHQSTSTEVKGALNKLGYIEEKKQEQQARIEKGIEHDREAIKSLIALKKMLEEKGREGTIAWLQAQLENYRLSPSQLDAYEGQLRYVETGMDIDADLARLEAKKPVEVVEITFQDPQPLQNSTTQVDKLILNYERGKELFISQACYACHRIAGFSRASVGPELTQAGLKYPWFIKESIVWPQADLPSSTMPNFRLDHDELEDLMTFLMAQTGDTKAISEVDYQISLNAWEEGAKMPWEKPVPGKSIDDVRQGMHVFVTEGCAACHKLEGFESNVGIAQENREWFYRLIPEQILGSKLAKVVRENGVEIDKKIVQMRHDGIIEELEKAYPGLVEGFYTNFKFASRALDDETDRERLHKLMMVYIQLYGMGRDIAPHLNWSGVFRDDAWLLGHFRNPPAYTAKSIMPVMPFDDSKFFMLNNMLHALGAKNRDRLQQMWQRDGFNPPLAYELLCSSCHGMQRQGNGIISEWIYPIPKNLRNLVFLRNLTKEQAVESITGGVSGTPMPPWGESVEGEPVLSASEITQLVDWLYQGLPEQPREEQKEDFEKWSYLPKDFDLYFNEQNNIRQKYYTLENLKEGEEFFNVNCATCHGKDGAGTGLRATSMVEAKPRMLTNLPWLKTRDDLRLIRSIKYGVPGTSMIPWGDQTTDLQRMQLVMYIRELSRAHLMREELNVVLYEVFDEKILELEKAEASREKIDLVKEERGIVEGVGAQMIEAEIPDAYIELYFNVIRDKDRDESLKAIFEYLDREISSSQNMEEQRVLINLKTKIGVQLAHVEELKEQYAKIQ